MTHYESGRLSRRELVALLTALAAAPRAGTAQPAALKAATLNHASLIVSDLDRSVAFYQRTFGLPSRARSRAASISPSATRSSASTKAARMRCRTSITSASASASFDPAATVAALEAQGLPAESRTRDGVTQVYTADPDNLRIQLQDVSFCGGVGALGNECRA